MLPSLTFPAFPVPGLRLRPVTAVAVFDAGGRILLEKRADCGLWGFPGGRMEAGESIADSARREVREETGLEVEITALVGVYAGPNEQIAAYPDNVVQFVNIVLAARVSSGSLVISSESEKLQFFDPLCLPPEGQIVPPARQPLRDALAGRTGVIG